MNLQKAIKLLEQEYERAQKMCWVHNPLAWALYRVWKLADGQKDWDEDCIRDCKNCWKTKLAVVHGHWDEWWPGDCAQIMTGEEKLYQCSACTAKYADVEGFRYCPHCGAFMDEERSNT